MNNYYLNLSKKIMMKQKFKRLWKWVLAACASKNPQPVYEWAQKIVFIPNANISRLWHELDNLTRNKGFKIVNIVCVESNETPPDVKYFDAIVVVEYKKIK